MQKAIIVLALVAAFVAVASAQYLAGYAAYPSAYSSAIYGAPALPAYATVASPGLISAGYPYNAAYWYKKRAHTLEATKATNIGLEIPNNNAVIM